MSDHNERACTYCGSLLHHETDCPELAAKDRPRFLHIKDRPGVTTVGWMQQMFVAMVTGTPLLASLDMTASYDGAGQFVGYRDPQTNMFWAGFAMGIRTAERVEKAGRLATDMPAVKWTTPDDEVNRAA